MVDQLYLRNHRQKGRSPSHFAGFEATIPRGLFSPYFTAAIYAGLGEKDQAFEWPDRSYEEREWLQLKLDPFLDNLRPDPRFRELLLRMNLPP